MKKAISPNSVFIPSGDITTRDIEGELLIIPMCAGLGDVEEELYSLNDTGRAIWAKLDGKKSLERIITELRKEYKGSLRNIKKDVIGIISELLKRRILIAK